MERKRKEEIFFEREQSVNRTAIIKNLLPLGPGGLAASGQLENLLEMQILELHPDLGTQNF